MSHVFISYAREDRAKAHAIAQGLERVGVPVWWDERLQLGQRFEPAILEAINESLVMIVLWSWSSVESDWVVQEAGIALKNDTLLPVRLDDAMPPGEFAALDCANLQDWKPGKPHAEFNQIVRVLKSLVGGSERGAWSAERLARDTLLVKLDTEQHTVQYTQARVFVDGEAATGIGNPVSDERPFDFDLSDAGERYMCHLVVQVSAFRGDVKRLTLSIGGSVIYDA